MKALLSFWRTAKLSATTKDLKDQQVMIHKISQLLPIYLILKKDGLVECDRLLQTQLSSDPNYI
jgi:hypothetical protein